ncbi:hypothetical protein AB0J63_20660 [Streptosporangium canum]|uniref:hypothetical protein n=1 Tax=Streptosporangium canum TaxID=324952 RepID=UPI003412BA93
MLTTITTHARANATQALATHDTSCRMILPSRSVPPAVAPAIPAMRRMDMIPGILPAWFVVIQVAGALVIAAAAFIVNGSRLRAAFPKSR